MVHNEILGDDHARHGGDNRGHGWRLPVAFADVEASLPVPSLMAQHDDFSPFGDFAQPDKLPVISADFSASKD